MSDERDFEQLQALRDHRAAFAKSPIVTVEEWKDRIILTAGGYELVIMKDSDASRSIHFSGVNIRTMENLIACQALLHKARELMGGV
jgi:hypothetical protein